jgi:hypothetical protein
MLMLMLTVTGVLSIVLMVRSVFIAEERLLQAIPMGIFGFISFILTIILTNGVAP